MLRRELRQLLKRRSQRRALCDGVVGVEETRRELSVEEPLEEPAFVRHKRRPKRLSRRTPLQARTPFVTRKVARK